MPRKSPPDTPEIAAARAHWRAIADIVDPRYVVTAERYSDTWMDQVDTKNFMDLFRELEEEKFIARLRRQATIDKLLKDATDQNDS